MLSMFFLFIAYGLCWVGLSRYMRKSSSDLSIAMVLYCWESSVWCLMNTCLFLYFS